MGSSDAGGKQPLDAEALSPVESELVLLLSMFPETTEQLEDMLETGDRQTLANLGGSVREGLLHSLRGLARLGAITADTAEAEAGLGTVWQLNEAGRGLVDQIKGRQ